MKRTSAITKRFPALYRHDVLDAERKIKDLSYESIAKELGMRTGTVSAVFKGIATPRKVYPIAQFLGVNWATLHDLESDFHLAVLNRTGGSLSAAG